MGEYGYGSASMTTGTATGTGTVIIVANTARKYIRISNALGGTPLYLGFGGSAAIANGLSKGIRMDGAGTPGSFYEMTRGAGNIYTGAIWGTLTVAGTAQLAVLEGS